MVLEPQRQHAGRQALGADRDRHLMRSMLAREPRERTGLGERHVSAIAGIARRFGEDVRAEGAGRQEHDLSIFQMRRECTRDVPLSGRRSWAENQVCTADRCRNVIRQQGGLCFMPPTKILHDDRAAGCLVGLDGRAVAAPEAHVMPGKRKIARRRERAVPAAKHRDAHQRSISRSRKCCTLPMALRGSASTNTYSRGTLKRASCVSKCASSAGTSIAQPARPTT